MYDDGSVDGHEDDPLAVEIRPDNTVTEKHDVHDGIVSEGSLSEKSEEWRMVTDNFETQSLDGGNSVSGVLILEGEDNPAESGGTGIPGSGDENGSVMNLSVPGTDSVPTVVGSLEELAKGQPLVAFSGFAGTSGDEPQTVAASCRTNSASQSCERFSHRMSFLIGVVVLAQTVGLGFLTRERYSLLVSIERLEHQVVELNEELEKKKRNDKLVWDSCDGSGDTIILDNCWLSAKGNVKLGDCAREAKAAILHRSVSLVERLEQLGSGSWSSGLEDDSLNYVGESLVRFMHKIDLAGRTFWNDENGEITQNKSRDHASSFLSTMDNFGHSLWKTTVTDVSRLSTGMRDATSSFLNFFSSGTSRVLPDIGQTNQTETVEGVFHGFVHLLAAATSFSTAAGEALIAATVEKATEALDFNQTLKYFVDAVEEASLCHGIDV